MLGEAPRTSDDTAKRSPCRAVRVSARRSQFSIPSDCTNCSAPPVQAGKPMPKMEPMLASCTLLSTPSARQRAVSMDCR
jgi:hypothetical protein